MVRVPDQACTAVSLCLRNAATAIGGVVTADADVLLTVRLVLTGELQPLRDMT